VLQRSARVRRLFVCTTYRANRTKTAAISLVTFERDVAAVQRLARFHYWLNTKLLRIYYKRDVDNP